MVEAKGSTIYNAIPEAEKTGHLKIVPMARATKIEVDSHGRATGRRATKGRPAVTSSPLTWSILATLCL